MSAGFRISDVGRLFALFALCASSSHASPTATTPAQAGEWLFAAGCIMGLVLMLLQIREKVSPTRKPPLEAEFVAKVDLDAHCRKQHAAAEAIVSRIEQHLAQLESEHKGTSAAARESDRRVHERLDRLVPVIYRIAGKLEVSLGESP